MTDRVAELWLESPWQPASPLQPEHLAGVPVVAAIALSHGRRPSGRPSSAETPPLNPPPPLTWPPQNQPPPRPGAAAPTVHAEPLPPAPQTPL